MRRKSEKNKFFTWGLSKERIAVGSAAIVIISFAFLVFAWFAIGGYAYLVAMLPTGDDDSKLMAEHPRDLITEGSQLRLTSMISFKHDAIEYEFPLSILSATSGSESISYAEYSDYEIMIPNDSVSTDGRIEVEHVGYVNGRLFVQLWMWDQYDYLNNSSEISLLIQDKSYSAREISVSFFPMPADLVDELDEFLDIQTSGTSCLLDICFDISELTDGCMFLRIGDNQMLLISRP